MVHCFRLVLVLVVVAACSEPPQPKQENCPARWPADLTPEETLVLAFEASPIDARHVAFEQDLVEMLLAGNRQIVPATSEMAETWPSFCVENRLEVTIEGDGDQRRGRLIWRLEGRVVIDSTETEPRSREPVLAGLRLALAAKLGLSGDPASLLNPASPAFEARQRALQSQAQGRLGEAADILRKAVEQHGGDASLHLRLGELLTAWAQELGPSADADKTSKLGFSRPRAVYEIEAAGLLQEALRHHEASSRLGGGGPLHHLARARTLMALRRNRAAEEELVAALDGWPAQGETALRLARLRLERGGAVGFESQLSEVIQLVDRRPTGLLSDLLVVLGQIERSAGRPEKAIAAWKLALSVAPPERRVFRSEIQAMLLEARPFQGEREVE